MNRRTIALIAATAALGLPTFAAANPIPPGWTELTCVVVDSRPILIASLEAPPFDARKTVR